MLLQHQHLLSGPGHQRGAGQPTHAAPDHYGVQLPGNQLGVEPALQTLVPLSAVFFQRAPASGRGFEERFPGDEEEGLVNEVGQYEVQRAELEVAEHAPPASAFNFHIV